jgi:hypothetical protein
LNLPPACSRHAFLGVDVRRDAAAVIAHSHAAIGVQRQRAEIGKPGLRLVHRIVDDLECHVVQARPIVGIADIHAGALTHRVKTSQNGDGSGVVAVPVRGRRA